MSTPNPFSPIEKAPLFASDQMQSKGYSVRIEDSGSESGWKEVGLVSNDYLLVPNTEVRDMAFEVARQSPFEWQQEKVQFDGKRFAFALSAKTGYGREVQTDDIVSLGLLFRNSYDGSLKLSASLFAYRLVCSNGMLSPQLFSRVRFKHELRSQGWEEDAQKALSMIQHSESSLKRFCSAATRLAELPVGSRELADLRQDGLSGLPVTLWGNTVDRFLSEGDHTGWGLMNAGTNILWHRDRSFSDYGYNEALTQALTRYALSEDEALVVSGELA